MDGLTLAYQAARQASLFTGLDVTFKEIVATLNAVRRIDFAPSRVEFVDSRFKSLTQRYLVLSALSDVAANSQCVHKLRFHRAGRGITAVQNRSEQHLLPGGTTARFMAALSLLTDRQICLEFASGLARRPMHMADALALAGKQTKIVEERDGKGIFLISGPKFAGGRVSVDACFKPICFRSLLLPHF